VPATIHAPPLDSLRIRTDGGRILDALDRQLLLRGVNAGGRSKLPPYMPFAFRESGHDTQADALPLEQARQAYVERLARWGLSVVRLPFSWEALEPERGSYDHDYLERYAALALACQQHGMRVIVDFHQDVFARPYAGDGFPLWACPTPTPPPAAPDHAWFMGYVQNEGVQRAFDRFWANDDGLRDAFAAMWRVVAKRLWQIDAVIGFEIINEPGWGSANPFEWAGAVLVPFYVELTEVIREQAPGAPIFFDATGADALSGTTGLIRPDIEDAIFAPHFYAPEVIMEGRWGGDRGAIRTMKRWAELAERWKIPVLLGEFGITPSAEGSAAYVRANYEQLDESLMHATLWECSTTSDDWNHEDMSVLAADGSERATVAELVRPYPRATAGELSRFSFDAETNRGELEMVARRGGVSELVLPAQRFAGSVSLELSGAPATAVHDADSGLILIRAEQDGQLGLRFALEE
jgi:endoglycosylceramidase